VNLFAAITEYANMAEAAKAPETPTQLINLGMIVLTQSSIFASDIRKWNEKAPADQTWPTFKSHFKNAQRAIKQSEPTVTTDSLGYHNQANSASIVDRVVDQLNAQRNAEAAAEAEAIAESQLACQVTNATRTPEQNESIAEQMKALAATIAKLNTKVNDTRPQGRGGGGRGGGRGGRGGRGNSKPSKYCWTHGNGTHGSPECNKKADGHIADSTFSNMQGGSTHRCFWL
jgi:hypothetical protein